MYRTSIPRMLFFILLGVLVLFGLFLLMGMRSIEAATWAFSIAAIFINILALNQD